MHVTNSRFARGTGRHNINLLTPTGRRPVDIRLVKIVYLCIHCLGRLKSHNNGVQCELNSNHYGYIHRDEADKLSQEERFMKIGKMFPSDYLRGLDIDKPFVVTIKSVTAEKARDQDGKMVDEFVMRFEELDKKLRLNLTMAKAAALALGDEEADTDNWIGKRVTVYQDKVKSFGKEHIVPRIREVRRDDVDLRKAIQQAQPPKNGKSANGKQEEAKAWEGFLDRMKAEFNLDEAGVKDKLKALNYKAFHSTKAEEMYESIKVLVAQESETDSDQGGLFDDEADISDELKQALGAYSEDM